MNRQHVHCAGFGLLLLSAGACSSGSGTDGSGGGGTASGGSLVGAGGSEMPGGSGGASTMGAGGTITGSGGTDASSGGSSTPAGGAASSGGDTGAGGSSLSLVEPIMRSDSSYVLEFGSYLFEIDPTQGARVVTFSYAGDNLLLALSGDSYFLNGGATFWVAPQDDWSWPPPPEMDQDPYTVSLDGNTIVTTSPTIPVADNDLTCEKRFSPNLDLGAIDIVYTVNNLGPSAAMHAPWEVSRHDRGGITVWPQGDDATCAGEFDPPVVDGMFYWDDTAQGLPYESDSPVLKVSCDGGGGWMAQLQGTLLFVKKWDDVPAANQHSADKEVQLYLGDGYIEMEMRGPYGSIAVDDSIDWNVRWYVRPAPSDTTAAGIGAAVQAILAGG